MPVYHVSLIRSDGTRNSAPVIADDSDDAIALYAARHDVDERDKTVTFEANDPDGTYEQSIADMERRRLEAEYYASPRKGRRR